MPQDPEFGIGSDWWREQFSIGVALVAVGTPLWAGHWIWAQRLARNDAEKGSALRALYFLGVLGVTIISAAGGAGEVLFALLARLAGGSPGPLPTIDSLADFCVYGVLWLYHIRIRPSAQLQTGAAATITRWYWYAVSFGSLGILVTSLIPLLSALLERLVDTDAVSPEWWQLPVAQNIAWIVVGSVGWAFHWAAIQRQTAQAGSPELHSVLRKVYLYVMVGTGAAGALVAVGRILYLALLNILGAAGEQQSIRDDLTWVLPVALIAATGWFYHRYHLQQDAALVAELPRQATIRRTYSYILTAIGISLLGAGAFGLLRLVIGILTGQADTLDLPENFLQQQLSLYVTLLLVGLLTWVWFWRQIQHRVQADDSGQERTTLVRRIYLYLVSAAGVVALVVAVGTLFYEGLRSVLGISSGNDFIDALNIYVSVALIAVTLLAYHVPFLRREHLPLRRRKGEEAPPAEPAATGQAALEAEGRSLVVTIIGRRLATGAAADPKRQPTRGLYPHHHGKRAVAGGSPPALAGPA